MKSMEIQYLELMAKVRREGIRQSNRTGIDCFTLPGAMLQCDLADGFPLITTKKVPFQSVIAELKGFLLGSSSAADFRMLGTKIWDANANENQAWLGNRNRLGPDDLGRIYGVQWRRWNAFDCYEIDQIHAALHAVRNNPESRRIIVSAWNPAELDQMALPPCHVMFQLIPNTTTGLLHMTMTQRSCDMFLGIPFNIASYAALLEIFSRWTGYKPGTLTTFLGDVHIYENHLDQVDLQLSRCPYEPCKLITNMYDRAPYEELRTFDTDLLIDFTAECDFNVVGYHHHDAISAPMAV